MVVDLEKVKENLKERLTEKRYNHSIGAMKAARLLARIYKEDEEEAAFAGLIHDIAKEMPKAEMEKYVKEHKIEVDEIEKIQMGLLHAKIGASIAKEEFGASKKVQEAICYHTTGNKDMNVFDKIIYLADKIEENRDYDGVKELREKAKSDLDEAMLFVLDFNIQKNIRKGILIYADTIELRNKLLMKKLENA